MLRNFLLILSISLAAATYGLLHEYSEDKDHAKIAFRGKNVESLLEKSFHQNLEVVYSIQNLFVTSNDITRLQFKEFVSNSLLRHTGIQAIEHMVLVRDSDRAKYEAQMQKEGYLHFSIKEFGPDKKIRPAAQRDHYHVINYVEPLQDNIAALGYDVSFTPEANEALQFAETKGIGVSSWLTLAQGELGFVVYLSIPRSEAVAAGVFRLRKFIEAALESSQSDGVDFKIEEISANPTTNKKILYYDAISNKLTSDSEPHDYDKELETTSLLTVGQRTWRLTFYPCTDFKSVIHPMIPVIAAFVVLLLMLSFTFLLSEREVRVTAETATKVREEFMTVASHELRTPLTPLKMEIFLVKELILAGQASQEKIVSLLDNANKHLNHIVGLIDDLLDVGRIGEEHYKYHFTPFELDLLIRDTLEKFEPVFKANGCSVQINLTPNVHVVWDAQRIEQVIANCLSNAVKFSNQAIIQVNLRVEGKFVIFGVKDNGIGISEEFQKKMFNKFERGVSNKNYGGLGLGLYIVHQIISAHGGSVRVISNPGEGAEFVFTVPSNV